MLEKTFKEKTFTLEILYHIGALEDSIHFIFDHDSKTCAIIDPAWDPQLFVKRIEDKGYTLTDIWLTHWHFDHTNAVDELVEMTGAKVTAGIYETPYLQIEMPARHSLHTLFSPPALSSLPHLPSSQKSL